MLPGNNDALLSHAIQQHRISLQERMMHSHYAEISYAEHVQRLDKSIANQWCEELAAYEQQAFWRRWFEKPIELAHKRRLLACYYEQQLVEQLLTMKVNISDLNRLLK